MTQFVTRYLTDAQHAKLMATVKSRAAVLARRDYAWMALLRATGLRVREFSLMTLGDAQFALKTRWLFIPKENRKATGGQPGKPGTREDHQLPLTKPVREPLEALCAIHTEMGGPGTPEAPLIFSRKHKRLSVRSYEARMAMWCDLAGIGHASPHWMRHARAQQIRNKSEAADVAGLIQKALGHKSIASAATYMRMSREEFQHEMEAVDGPDRLPKAKVAAAYAAEVETEEETES